MEARKTLREIIKSKNIIKTSMADHHKLDTYTSTASIWNFINGEVISELSSVPGLNSTNIEILNSVNITTTHQLIGKFLCFRTRDISPYQHTDLFWEYLESIGLNRNRSSVVLAIAEKCERIFPGIYPVDWDVMAQ
jgi:hypothetical protein